MIEVPSIQSYADTMSRRIWLRIGWQIETRKLTYRGVAARAGVDHSTIIHNIKTARAGMVPPDTKIDTIARISEVLGKPVSFFLQI